MTYPVENIIRRARKGKSSIYPSKSDHKSFSLFGTNPTSIRSRLPNLDDLLIVPPQFTPERLEKCNELIFREPVHLDVETRTTIGGFQSSAPLIQASMGSPEDWNRIAPFVAQAAARKGIVIGIGENVASTWGYDKRVSKNQPCLLERIMTYLEHTRDGIGGIVIQQNEEDAQDELWNKLYADPRLAQYFVKGMIGFEIKGGQGAKAGMGGEKLIDRHTALRLNSRYYIHPDPETNIRQYYERYSAPDIFTEDILFNRISKLKNDYPRARIWLKTGPYRDLQQVIKVAEEAGADCLVVDGKEGGTGMSPSVAINQIGIPTLACLAQIRNARKRGILIPIVISGRLTSGADIVKSLALGATAVALGRPFVIAAYAYPFANTVLMKNYYQKKLVKKIGLRLVVKRGKTIRYIHNFLDSLILEIQLLTAALGKYYISKISTDDIISLRSEVGNMLKINTLYSENRSDQDLSTQVGNGDPTKNYHNEIVSTPSS